MSNKYLQQPLLYWGISGGMLDEVLNVRPDIIEHQLAHSVRDLNGRAYNRTAH